MLTKTMQAGLFLLALTLLAGCGGSTDPQPLKVSLGKSFELEDGETALVEDENLEFSFVQVNHDNRCPVNADCIWPGTAQIEFKLKSGNSWSTTRKVDLLAGADSLTLDLFSTCVFGYSIRFEQLEPYPGMDAKFQTPPEPPGKRARIRISHSSIYPPTDGYVSITDVDPTLFKLDPFELDTAWCSGDTLLCKVTAAGGCERQYYFLYMAPTAFFESNPAQANIYLRHFANYDNCESLIPRLLLFDISEIRLSYEQLYGKFSPLQLNVFDYADGMPETSHAVLYAPTLRLIPFGVGHYWIYEVKDARSSQGPLVEYLDTITTVPQEYVNGKWWWELTGKSPGLIFGFETFSYRGDTVITRENCGSELIEALQFVPLTSGSYEYRASDCLFSNRYNADQVGDTTIYEWCRRCSDAGHVWKILPGIGIVSGSVITFTGGISWRLLEYGHDGTK